MRFKALHSTTSNSQIVQRRKAQIAPLLHSKERYFNSQEIQGLFRAVKHKQIKEIEALLEKENVSPNERGKYGDTSLIFAAEWGDVQTVECLLEHNADPNAKNGVGLTALMLAVRRSMNTQTIDILIENGAKVRIRNYFLGTVLDEARWARWLPEETKDKLEQRWVEEGLFYQMGAFVSKRVLRAGK